LVCLDARGGRGAAKGVGQQRRHRQRSSSGGHSLVKEQRRHRQRSSVARIARLACVAGVSLASLMSFASLVPLDGAVKADYVGPPPPPRAAAAASRATNGAVKVGELGPWSALMPVVVEEQQLQS
jgi:hypothetical protein